MSILGKKTKIFGTTLIYEAVSKLIELSYFVTWEKYGEIKIQYRVH